MEKLSPRRGSKSLSLLAACTMAVGFEIPSVYAATFDEALTGGKANVDMRLRYESVDDSTNDDAEALTLRTRLGYMTGDYDNFSAFAEFEDVRVALGMDDYAPQNTGFATIADPEVTELNQAFIAYQAPSATKVRLGRQRIILDNARFVGNVGWRQNEQTFDALSIVNTSLADTAITYAFLDKVNGILSSFDADVSDHLLNVTYSGLGIGAVTAYAYLLEDDNTDATNDTYGVRLSGSRMVSEGNKVLYTAEIASQSTDDNDAIYSFFEGGMSFGGITAKLALEVLGSDKGAYAFQTPLATKHAFNGWADKFLATPADGLQDLMVSVGGMVAGVKLLGVFHDFSADEGSDDYGKEMDLLAVKKISKRYTVGAKLASYDADTFSADTDKFWLWGEMNI